MLTRALLIHTDIHMYAHVTLSSFSDMVCDGPEGDRKGRGVDGRGFSLSSSSDGSCEGGQGDCGGVDEGEGGDEGGGGDEGEGGCEGACDNHRSICTGKQLSTLTGLHTLHIHALYIHT